MDQRILKNLIKLAIGILLASVVWWYVKCHCITLSPASVRGYIRSFGNLSALAYISMYALNTVSVFPPIGILSLSGGLVFGKIWGAVFLLTGAMLGTSATFFISRFLARGIIERFVRGKFKELDATLERRGFSTVLFLRLIPIVPFELLNYACGLSKMKFRSYFLATLLGFIPWVFIVSFFGGTLGEIAELKDLFTNKMVLALVALIIVILAPVIYRRLKKGKKYDS